MTKREKLALLGIRERIAAVMTSAADDADTSFVYGENYMIACLQHVGMALGNILHDFDQLMEGGVGFTKLEIDNMIRREAERLNELRATRAPVPSERMLDL